MHGGERMRKRNGLRETNSTDFKEVGETKTASTEEKKGMACSERVSREELEVRYTLARDGERKRDFWLIYGKYLKGGESGRCGGKDIKI